MVIKAEHQNLNLIAAKANAIYLFSSMLPSVTEPAQLVAYGPALFARLEKVQVHKKQIEGPDHLVSEADRVVYSKLIVEEQMLQQTLDWIRDCDTESNP